jgi:hypothetical protein
MHILFSKQFLDAIFELWKCPNQKKSLSIS